MLDTLWPLLIEQVLMPLIVAAIGAALTWAAARFHQWTGIQIEAKHRQALQSALENGARYGIEILRERGGQIDWRDPTLMQGIMDDAIEYVSNSVPDAIRHFGLSIPQLEQLLRPKLPVMTPEEALAWNNAQTGADQTTIPRR